MVNHLAYADDLVLLCPSIKGLQKLINVCEQYGNDHCITYNCLKTVCMSIMPKGSKLLNTPTLSLNGRHLSFVSSYKYLGVHITDTLKDDDDISRQLRSFYARSNFLLRNFNACSIQVKAKLFTAFCANMYCGHLWSSHKKASLTKIIVAYNNCFRRLMGLERFCSASTMFVTNTVSSFGELLRRYVYKFKQRIMASNNTIVSCVMYSAFYNDVSIWRSWNSILY